ncbi:protein of unknown function [Shewanella benthica]|uniref:Uncharacterized protein n=1 Tax=Shewanella benthica TaxID=43661 RepID=A0A330M0Z2_9GAMM|nr:protein of unknown function [Shewanella benthica]
MLLEEESESVTFIDEFQYLPFLSLPFYFSTLSSKNSLAI